MFSDSLRRRQILLTVAVALFSALALPFLFDSVRFLGAHITAEVRDTDRVNDYIKGCFAALSFLGLLFVLPVSSEDKKNLLILWAAKIVVVLFLMLFYEANYGLDAYWYFQQSQNRFPDLSQVGFGNGTANIAALFWYFEHMIFHTGSFHTQKTICAFLGLSGIYFFHRGLKGFYPALPDRFLLFVGLFPSILFWSSTMGKDAIMLFGIGLSFFGMFRLKSHRNVLYAIFAVFGLLVVGLIRTWMIPILVLPLAVSAVLTLRNLAWRILILGMLLAGCYYGVVKLGDTLAIENVDQLAQNVGQTARSWQEGGSAGNVPIMNTPAEVLAFLPIGMFTALFRPLPGEVMNPFGMLAGLESLLSLYLLYRAIRAWRRNTWGDPLVIWLGAYVLAWSMLYAFLSPQNLGAAVRFRLQVLPVLLTFLVYVAYFRGSESAEASDEP